MKKPIMLWITSRSRSSMVSNIFIQHGVWWGNTHAKISGYEMYENQEIKQLQNKYNPKWGRPFCRPIEASDDVFLDFRRELRKIVPDGVKWMMKTGVEYFNAYKALKPYNVFIRRNPEDVAKSLSSKRKDVQYEEALKVAKWRFAYMEELEREHGGVYVNTDLIKAGEFSQIKMALEYCGLEPDEEKIKKGITR